MANHFYDTPLGYNNFFDTAPAGTNNFFDTAEGTNNFFDTAIAGTHNFFDTAEGYNHFFDTAPAGTHHFYDTAPGHNHFYDTAPAGTNHFYDTAGLEVDVETSPETPTYNITVIEGYRTAAKDEVKERVLQLLAAAEDHEYVGESAASEYYDINAIMFVIDYLSFIRTKMDEDEAYGIERETNFYYVRHKIEAMERKFRCLKINIAKLVDIFHIKDYDPDVYEYPDVTENEDNEGLFDEAYDIVFD
jgi:hypothetical protein